MKNKKLIHTVFEEIVKTNSTSIAIKQGKKSISYNELNSLANQLANLLVSLGTAKGEIVATSFQNEIRNVIALVSIFKLGGVYMPVSEQYGKRHWDIIHTEIKPQVLITSEDVIKNKDSNLADNTFNNVITINSENYNLNVYKLRNGHYEAVKICQNIDSQNLNIDMDPESANYLFFSSGTTGIPKAILGMHKSLSHFLHWESSEFNITKQDKVSHLVNNTFDASLRDIFIPLINGGTLCIPEDDKLTNLVDMISWIKESEISIIHTVPSIFRSIIECGDEAVDKPVFKNLRYILLAGEMLFARDVYNWRKLFGENTTIVNLYGATESTLVKTFFKVGQISGDLNSKIPVGQPISSTEIIIINSERKLCKIHEVGEVYIRTPFLSKGYFNNPALTNEIFIPNPLGNDPYDLVYKTGDTAKYIEERNILILGRKDDEIKVRGIRINLTDIESIVLSNKDVLQAKCVLNTGTIDKQVICYYTTSNDLTELMLASYCRSILASYEMPAIFVKLEKIPLSVNGKVDNKALASRSPNLLMHKKQTEKTKIEGQLITMWKEILGLENVGVTDNFFEIGGHSLNLIRLISRITKEFNVKISVEALFNNPTIENITEEIEKIYWVNKDTRDSGDKNQERFLI